jgi:glycerol-3-phosphate dehydrogenase subunit B
MSFGVLSDDRFRVLKDGVPVQNLYAAGSLLGGCNPVKEGSGAGIAMITALYVSDLILGEF